LLDMSLQGISLANCLAMVQTKSVITVINTANQELKQTNWGLVSFITLNLKTYQACSYKENYNSYGVHG